MRRPSLFRRCPGSLDRLARCILRSQVRWQGLAQAWLVSVVAKPDGSFEARAYHPGTSVELSLPVPRAAAPAGKNPDRWAADVLPSKLVLDMGSGRPELVLRSTSPTRRR